MPVPNAPQIDKFRSRNALFLDYDGDRRLDLFVTGDCWDCVVVGPPFELEIPARRAWAKPRLFRQLADGTFRNVTVEAGLGDVDFLADCGDDLCSVADLTCDIRFEVLRHLGGFAAADLNGDSLPDLFVGHWFSTGPSASIPNGRIFMSDMATGQFTTTGGLIPSGLPSHWQTVMADFNDDGIIDVFNARDGATNTLYINEGPGSILHEDAVNAGLDHTTDANTGAGGTDMGVAVGDFDNDGYFDLYLTNTNSILTPGLNDQFLFADSAASRQGPHFPVVHIDRNPQFMLQYVDEEQSWGWGVTAFDANLDGWEDLAITNGFSMVPSIDIGGGDDCDGRDWPNQHADQSLFFLNRLGTAFADFDELSSEWAFDDTLWGSALGAFDFDRDGDLDLAQTVQQTFDPDPFTPSRFRLLENHFADENTVNWLVVRPRLTTRNTRSLGAIVRASYIEPGEGGGGGTPITQSRLISAGESFMTQEPAEAHFGFGPVAPTEVTITIEWPDDTADSVFVLQANELNRAVTYGWCDIVDVARPCGKLDWADLAAFVLLHGDEHPLTDLAEPFGVFDNADIIEAATRIGNGCTTVSIPNVNDLPPTE